MIDDLLNELSLCLLLHGEEDDAQEKVLVLLESIAQEATTHHPRLVEAVGFMKRSLPFGSPAELEATLSGFISDVQQFLIAPDDVTFSSEAGSVKDDDSGTQAFWSDTEVVKDFRKEFFPEFVERHSNALEEIEGSVLDACV